MKAFKMPLAWRLKRKQYLDELRRRGLCLYCLQPNDRDSHRCSRCNRKAYVLTRIRKCQRYIAQYQAELKARVDERREWKTQDRREAKRKAA